MSAVLAKFAILTIRTLAKPIASTIKARARQHGKFRQTCIFIAQKIHNAESHMKMGLLGTEATIRPLNDAKAIETGANFISECFLFSVAGSLIIAESMRSRAQTTARREGVAEDIANLQSDVALLRIQLEDAKVIKPLPRDTPDDEEKIKQSRSDNEIPRSSLTRDQLREIAKTSKPM